MSYYQLFYHIVTTTKNREPLLTPSVEPIIFQFVKSKALDLEATVYAINGTEDHIHLVVSIPPKIAVATFVRQIKGFASSSINKTNAHLSEFAWQNQYGVFSFDRKRLPNCMEYVERQKEHHRLGTLIDPLERYEEDGRSIAETGSDYEVFGW